MPTHVGASNQCNVVRSPAEEEDHNKGGDGQKVPVLLETFDAAVELEKDPGAADNESGSGQHEAQHVIKDPARHLPADWLVAANTQGCG